MKKAIACVLLVLMAAGGSLGTGLSLPYVWTVSMPDVAQLNAVFAAVKAAVDDNDARLDALFSTDACTVAPCDLTPGTTIGGAVIGGAPSALALDQASGNDLRRDSGTGSYYYDVDGDGSRDTDGSESFLDTITLEVPGDYATVQDALDSNHCKKGNTENTGCHIRVANGKYAQSFEIGGVDGTTYQYSIIVEGVAPGGAENSAGKQTCGVTFTGDDTTDNTVIRINGTIGWSIRNLCIDMDESATHNPKYGLALGPDDIDPVKHGVLENVDISDSGISGGAAIRIGTSSNGDIAFNAFRNLRLENNNTCIINESNQAVDNSVFDSECTHPTGAVGGINLLRGELSVLNFYMSTTAANQIGINIGNIAIPIEFDRLTFEWAGDDGVMINWDSTGNNGNYRALDITNSRFKLLPIAGNPAPGAPTTRHVFINWDRIGTLNLLGNSFESPNSAIQGEIDLRNPSTTKESVVTWQGNDVQWDGTQAEMVFNTSTAGGLLKFDPTTHTFSTSSPTDGTTKCMTGDQHTDTDDKKLFVCVDGATEKWYGVQLVDSP